MRLLEKCNLWTVQRSLPSLSHCLFSVCVSIIDTYRVIRKKCNLPTWQECHPAHFWDCHKVLWQMNDWISLEQWMLLWRLALWGHSHEKYLLTSRVCSSLVPLPKCVHTFIIIVNCKWVPNFKWKHQLRVLMPSSYLTIGHIIMINIFALINFAACRQNPETQRVHGYKWSN